MRTIGVIKLIVWDSDQMSVDIGRIHHGRNNIFDSRGTQKAKIHLKLVLENIRKVQGL